MTDINAFLLARYGEIAAQTRMAADDSATPARQVSGRYTLIALPTLTADGIRAGRTEDDIGTSPAIAWWDLGRVLADVDAKRHRLRLHRADVRATGERHGSELYCEHDGQPWPCPDLRLDALPFADHPDYQQEWRPAPPAASYEQPRNAGTDHGHGYY